MRDFWTLKHQTQDPLWLTGSSLWEISHYHGINDFSDLLEIGVGNGSLKAELEEKGLLDGYIGVDIAPVTDYLTEDLKKIPKVRLAVCHLVFQHCEPDEIRRIINDVRLKRKGILSFQIAVLRDKPPTRYEPLYFTTLDEIKQIIKQTNKRLVSISAPFHHEEFDWYILRVK